jgi:hypothetical protein
LHSGVFLQQRRAGDEHQYRGGVYWGIARFSRPFFIATHQNQSSLGFTSFTKVAELFKHGSSMPSVGYIAYIDEAGDDGLTKIRTPERRGASEWMIISAILIKASRENEVLGWTKNIINQLKQHQTSQIHYYKLPYDKKLFVCSQLASLHVRVFSVISHKRNMQGYKNIRAEMAKVNRTAYFYCWMTHLLLERVTAYCGRRTIKDYGEARPIRFEFSDRGGVKIEDIKAYYRYIMAQSRMGMLYNPRFDLDWTVVDPNEMYSYPNSMRAGLQLADIAASSFYGGLELANDGTTKPEPAKLLLPRICPDQKSKRYGFGVKLMPVWVPNLPPEQADLINFYMSK